MLETLTIGNGMSNPIPSRPADITYEFISWNVRGHFKFWIKEMLMCDNKDRCSYKFTFNPVSIRIFDSFWYKLNDKHVSKCIKLIYMFLRNKKTLRWKPNITSQGRLLGYTTQVNNTTISLCSNSGVMSAIIDRKVKPITMKQLGELLDETQTSQKKI